MYIPDAVFQGDKYGIPLLDLSKQAEFIVPPVRMWGQNTRRQVFTGTFGFYVKDYKFSALWKHPENLLFSGCQTIIEPNFSTSDEMPEAVGIFGIYQKRWLARFWQTKGINVIVDLNVSEKFLETNLLGVPDGWSSFATRAQKGSNNLLKTMFDLACYKAGNNPKLFLVYGGGKEIESMCNQNKWMWIPEHMAEIKAAYHG